MNTPTATVIPDNSGERAIPDDPEQRRVWILYQLKIRGLTLASLARKYSTSRQSVSVALVRSRPRWEHVIASVLDCSPVELWPERYDPKTGIPLPQGHESRRGEL